MGIHKYKYTLKEMSYLRSIAFADDIRNQAIYLLECQDGFAHLVNSTIIFILHNTFSFCMNSSRNSSYEKDGFVAVW